MAPRPTPPSKRLITFPFNEEALKAFSELAEESAISRNKFMEKLIRDFIASKPSVPPQDEPPVVTHAAFRLPRGDLDELMRRAKSLGISRNQLVNFMINEHLERIRRERQLDLFN